MPESACEIIWFSGWIEGLNDVVKLKVDAKPGMIKNSEKAHLMSKEGLVIMVDFIF